MGFDTPREKLEAGYEAEQDELQKMADLRDGKASDRDLLTWVSGLMETLEMVDCRRAQGDEWIDSAYLNVLRVRLDSTAK